MNRTERQGLTLIELSLVLVIIGLLIGGVLAGKDLIRAAQVRKTLSTITEFNTAFNTFAGKYGCLPGDCAAATRFFGELDADESVCRDAAPHGDATCNGNGDGLIQASQVDSGGVRYEEVYAWEHLSIAKLVRGTYRHGISTRASSCEGLLPRDKLSCFSVVTLTGTSASMIGLSGPIYFLGGYPSEDFFSYDPVLDKGGFAPDTAFAIDSKLDDGHPGSGNIRRENIFWDDSRCVSGTDPLSYDFADLQNSCALVVRASF